jgi:hypothetical protein
MVDDNLHRADDIVACIVPLRGHSGALAHQSVVSVASALFGGHRQPHGFVIALHGAGGTIESVAAQWQHATQLGYAVGIPLSSQRSASEDDDRRGWDDIDLAAQEVAGARDRLAHQLELDPERAIFAGFSQGGRRVVEWALMGTLPDVRCVIGVASGVDQIRPGMSTARWRRQPSAAFEPPSSSPRKTSCSSPSSASTTPCAERELRRAWISFLALGTTTRPTSSPAFPRSLHGSTRSCGRGAPSS